MRHRRASLLIFVLCVLVHGRAGADPDALADGMAAYDALDYPRAVELLSRALGEKRPDAERRVIVRTLAFAHVALDQLDDARAELELLCSIDPTFVPDRTESPRVRVVFEQARANFERRRALRTDVVVAAPPPPPPPRADKPKKRTWLWVTIGGVAAAVVVGTVTAAVLASDANGAVHLSVRGP